MCDWKKSRFETNIYLSGTIASPLLLVRLRLIRLSLSIYPVFEKLKILVLWSFFFLLASIEMACRNATFI